MSIQRKTNRFLLLMVLAAIGVSMVSVPSLIIKNYQFVSELGRFGTYLYLGTVGIGGAILLVLSFGILWKLWRGSARKRKRKELQSKNPSELSNAQQKSELDSNLAMVDDFQNDPDVDEDLRLALAPLVDRIQQKTDKKHVEIVAFGTISSGKSSLLNALAGRDIFSTDLKGGTTVTRNQTEWSGDDSICLVDTPGLGEVEGEDRAEIAADSAKNADLVLVVVDGPFRDSEHNLLRRLAQMEKRIVVCLNKEDLYDDEDRQQLLGQIAHQVADFVEADDVVAVQSQNVQRNRMRVLTDGTQHEETVDVPADIEPLAARMMNIVRRDGGDLVMANLLLQSRGLVEQAKQQVRRSLDRRAWEIVDRHMWGAGGAAALSPLPVVDLAAGCAISTKMVLDLARVYRQDMDMEAAVSLLGEQGKNLLAVMGTSVATPSITAGIASMMKTVPGVGTIAGGMLQGVVQALVTRWIGAVFITYFKNEMQEPPGGLAALARREWEKVTSATELRKLVRSVRHHFQSGDDE